MADGSVTFTVELDDRDAQKEIDRLSKKIKSVEEDQSIKKVTKERYESELKTISEAYKASLKTDDTAMQETLSKNYDTVSAKLERVKESMLENDDVIKALRSEAGRYTEEMVKAGDAGESAFAKARETVREFATNAAIGIKGIITGIIGFGKQAVSIFKNIGTRLIAVAKRINVFSRAIDAIEPKLKRIRGLIGRVFVFSVITAGLRHLRKTLSEWLEQNTQLTAALANLKGVFATAFEPIFSAAIPALTALLNVLTQVIAAIAQFNAYLFGKTAKQAQDNAKALTEQADATKAAGGAASKAAKQLANFDEINQLTDKSGGGASTTAPTFDFEFENIDVSDWGQKFSDTLDRIIEKLKALPAIFSGIAASINEKVKGVLDALTFDGLTEKMQTIGKLLAESFNQLVKDINWYNIGAALGAGLQLALSAIVGFIYTFDWQQLGGALAAMLNGLVSQIHWDEVGKMLWAGFKIAIETLAGFLLGLDMPQLAKAASNIVINFFNSMQDTLKNIEWYRLGEQLRDFLVNVDWAGVAHSVFTAIGGAFGAAASFLWGLIHDAWEGIVQWWHDVAFEDGKFTVDGLLSGIFWKLDSIKVWLEQNVFTPIINGFREVFKIGSPSKVFEELGGYLIDGLFIGLSNIGNKVSEWGNSLLNGIRNVLSVHSPSRETEEIGEYCLEGFVNGMKNLPTITAMFNTEIQNMTAIATMFADTTEKLIEAVYKLFTEMLKKAEDTTRAVTIAMSTMFSNMAATSISAIQSIISALNSIPREITTVHTIIERTASGGSNLPFISTGNVPRLAQGAVIPPNREFLAVLGDQKSGTNIEAPLDTITQAVTAALGNSGFGRNMTVILEMDRREFARASFKAYNEEQQRIGVSLGSAY